MSRKLALIPNQARALSNEPAFLLDEVSPEYARAEGMVYGTTLAFTLDQDDRLPHCILHDSSIASQTVARVIASYARQKVREPERSSSSRLNGRGKSRLRSQDLLPDEPTETQQAVKRIISGIVSAHSTPVSHDGLHERSWQALRQLVYKLESIPDGVGIIIAEPERLEVIDHALRGRLTQSIWTERHWLTDVRLQADALRRLSRPQRNAKRA